MGSRFFLFLNIYCSLIIKSLTFVSILILNLKILSEDKDYIEGLILGDEFSFKRIYDKYHANLFKYSLKFVKSEENAKEIVHDVFLKIWINRQTINPHLPFKYYLIKICKNTTINFLTRKARENFFQQNVLLTFEEATNETEDLVMASDLQKFFDQAVENLPPQRQNVYRLCRIEGKSYEEVAEALSISKGTVRDHMLKAAKYIRKYLSVFHTLLIAILALQL